MSRITTPALLLVQGPGGKEIIAYGLGEEEELKSRLREVRQDEVSHSLYSGPWPGVATWHNGGNHRVRFRDPQDAVKRLADVVASPNCGDLAFNPAKRRCEQPPHTQRRSRGHGPETTCRRAPVGRRSSHVMRE